jgi:hypothetical protein
MNIRGEAIIAIMRIVCPLEALKAVKPVTSFSANFIKLALNSQTRAVAKQYGEYVGNHAVTLGCDSLAQEVRTLNQRMVRQATFQRAVYKYAVHFGSPDLSTSAVAVIGPSFSRRQPQRTIAVLLAR